MLNVGVIGTGYVGLVTGACLSELGHRVVCVDTDELKIGRLKAGEIPIYEPGLKELVATNVGRRHLSFATGINEAATPDVDVLFVAVGTPADADGGGAVLSYVYGAAEEVARALAAHPASPDQFTVIVTKSTVPVGTSWQIANILGAHLPSERYAVASNPEFLREGSGVRDFMEPDRVVIGAESERARKVLEKLYLPLIRKGRPLVVTSTVETAELIKYAANAFLATKVTFINELARLCEATGANIEELAVGVGLDTRIGQSFLSAGPGFGGSCFPKDLRALVKTASDFGSPVEIVETVLRVNDRHKDLMVEKIRSALGGDLRGRTLGVLGLAFKANTDDMRDAPSLTILPKLTAAGAVVKAYDPQASANAVPLLPGVTIVDWAEDALVDADAALVLTEWDEFRSLNWRRLAATMRAPVLIDLRNIFEPEDIAEQGLRYVSLGRREFQNPLEAAAAE